MFAWLRKIVPPSAKRKPPVSADERERHERCGNMFLSEGNLDEAIASYGNALSINPDFAEAHRNESLCRLLNADFEKDWEKYEWRWKNPQLKKSKRHLGQPQWFGKESLQGKTILHAEQGYGDTIQFCRYAKPISAQGATVILLVSPALKTLRSRLAGVSGIFVEGEQLTQFDYHCPMPSLPLAFNTTLHSIPAEAAYLECDAGHVDFWKAKLGQKKTWRISLARSGHPEHANDRNRSLALADMFNIVSHKAEFISLQKEVPSYDLAFLHEHESLRHFGNDLQDFSDTAGLIANMDLVVSVDTPTAHLAAAIGKPTWILPPFVPDWRWLTERTTSPWHPSVRLFRQPRIGDWDSVFQSIIDEMRRLLSQPTAFAR
ncbi:MAG TPA: tetratricopeptide repeat protein [Paucimonas sp.]|nr:tetratricopeptide repeat protein [Paucimonas sp.]